MSIEETFLPLPEIKYRGVCIKQTRNKTLKVVCKQTVKSKQGQTAPACVLLDGNFFDCNKLNASIAVELGKSRRCCQE
jgi:hypothetical protein